MKYHFSELKDKSRWNQFVSSFPKKSGEHNVPTTTFVQSYNWMEFQETLGNDTLPLGIYEGSKLIGVAAGVIVRAKRGNYLYIRNGPIIEWRNEELIRELTSYLKDFCKQNNLKFIRISPLIEKGSTEESTVAKFNFVDCPMHDVEALDTWVMSLKGTEEDVFQKQKKKLRYEIRNAVKLGCTVEVSKDVKDIDTFYDILKNTVQRQNWNAYSKEHIMKEFLAFEKDDMASIVLVKYQGQYIAGGVFIHFADQTVYHYGASMTEFKHIPGAYLMIWEAVKEAKQRGNIFFNFWGISPENRPNHPWQGLSKFKMKFEGFAVRWAISKDIPVTPIYWFTNLYERIDKYRKGY